jgi:RimJ/RimL family protein N-acetyltransferase
MPGPVFAHGSTVELRTIEREDLNFLHEHINNPKIRRTFDQRTPINHEQEQSYFSDLVCDDDLVNLLLCVDSRPVGTVEFNPLDQEQGIGDIGAWIAPDEWRNGYASDAIRAMISYGFEDLGLHKVVGRVLEPNESSQRMLENIGFVREGTLRSEQYFEGCYVDVYRYGILKTNWEADS